MDNSKRKYPRFKIKFILSSNNIEGDGINISNKGLGFLTEEELIPAEDIPFEAEIHFDKDSNTKHIKGRARLLYSTASQDYSNLYYNGFEFIELDANSKLILDHISLKYPLYDLKS